MGLREDAIAALQSEAEEYERKFAEMREYWRESRRKYLASKLDLVLNIRESEASFGFTTEHSRDGSEIAFAVVDGILFRIERAIHDYLIAGITCPYCKRRTVWSGSIWSRADLGRFLAKDVDPYFDCGCAA